MSSKVQIFYSIKKPCKKKGNGLRKSWSVHEERRIEGKRTNKVVKNEFIAKINESYKEGKLSFDKAYEALQKHFDNIRKKTSSTYTPPTRDEELDKHLLQWREQLLNKRLREPESDYNIINHSRKMHLILKATKKTIFDVTPHELRKAIKDKIRPTSERKKQCFYFNNYLAYAKRDIKMDASFFSGEDFEYTYITSIQLDELVSKAPPELAKPMRILFYTGIRLGELYGLQRKDWKGLTLWIDRQQKKTTGEFKKPKCNKQRTTMSPAWIHKDLEWWFSGSGKLKRNSFEKKFKSFCRQNGHEKLRIHDLRHSFAMYCLQEKKISISMIAKLIGDRVDICEKHYLGNRLSQETVEDLVSGF